MFKRLIRPFSLQQSKGIFLAFFGLSTHKLLLVFSAVVFGSDLVSAYQAARDLSCYSNSDVCETKLVIMLNSGHGNTSPPSELDRGDFIDIIEQSKRFNSSLRSGLQVLSSPNTKSRTAVFVRESDRDYWNDQSQEESYVFEHSNRNWANDIIRNVLNPNDPDNPYWECHRQGKKVKIEFYNTGHGFDFNSDEVSARQYEAFARNPIVNNGIIHGLDSRCQSATGMQRMVNRIREENPKANSSCACAFTTSPPNRNSSGGAWFSDYDSLTSAIGAVDSDSTLLELGFVGSSALGFTETVEYTTKANGEDRTALPVGWNAARQVMQDFFSSNGSPIDFLSRPSVLFNTVRKSTSSTRNSSNWVEVENLTDPNNNLIKPKDIHSITSNIRYRAIVKILLAANPDDIKIDLATRRDLETKLRPPYEESTIGEIRQLTLNLYQKAAEQRENMRVAKEEMHSAEEKYNSAYEAELRKIVSNKNGGTTISDLDIENLDSLLTPDEINDLENEILKQIPNEYANFENTKRNFSEHENRANSAKAAIQALAIIDAENHFLKTAPPEQIRNWANEIPCLVTVYGPGETAHIPNSVITHRLPPSQKPKDVEHVSAPPSRSPQSIGGTTASVDPNNRRNTPTISPAGEAQPL